MLDHAPVILSGALARRQTINSESYRKTNRHQELEFNDCQIICKCAENKTTNALTARHWLLYCEIFEHWAISNLALEATSTPVVR